MFALIPWHTGRAGNPASAVTGWLSPSPGLKKQSSEEKEKKKGRKKKEKCGVCVSHARKSVILVTKGSAQPHSEMHQDHVHHLGPHLNFIPNSGITFIWKKAIRIKCEAAPARLKTRFHGGTILSISLFLLYAVRWVAEIP